ncbi:MAG: QueT transporter family protein [Oscillospiraceae bacterium]|jgi:uncharacterized membrane protein|nr:QueT transporter family protein [Oscillospiraceae bacterium]
MRNLRTRNLVVCAMIAALYTALCLVLSPLSYGMVQVRVAEALTLLPVFSPIAIVGVTFGCALSNLVGFMSGANILGFLDIFFGTAATLVAALMSYRLRNVRTLGLPVLSAIPPVVVNAVVIGLELMWMETGGFNLTAFAVNALYVGAGQAISCVILGLPLVYVLRKTGVSGLIDGNRRH